jgi:hypothetical protein
MGWDLFTNPDPTHRLVQFIDRLIVVYAIKHSSPRRLSFLILSSKQAT